MTTETADKSFTHTYEHTPNYWFPICLSDINLCQMQRKNSIKPVSDYVIHIRSNKQTIRTPSNVYWDRLFFLIAVGVSKLSMKKEPIILIASLRMVFFVFLLQLKLTHANLHILIVNLAILLHKYKETVRGQSLILHHFVDEKKNTLEIYIHPFIQIQREPKLLAFEYLKCEQNACIESKCLFYGWKHYSSDFIQFIYHAHKLDSHQKPD